METIHNSEIDFVKGGDLVPVIIQDHRTNEVLMLGYMNYEAWCKTQETGKVHYFSRSRNKLWLKGEESGHFQMVKETLIDCDNDTVLIRVTQLGKGACHMGFQSCFFRTMKEKEWKVSSERIFNPEEVYKK